ncbi:MAG: acyltransferase family protein [Muribaculaceae bacterium]|nr:acyltransferase family protein [Muribaculaceae bacterium]
MKSRDKSFDILKAIAIFLVIWQHSISCLGYGMEMMETYVGRAICMVNMPLFMFIVGYFSKSSIEAPLKKMLIKKWNTLLLPMCIFCLISTAIQWAYNPMAANDLLEWRGGKLLLISIIKGYWFIWALLYSVLFFRFFYYLFKKIGFAWVSLISLIAIMLIPRWLPVPHFMYTQSMYPFFVLGLISKEYEIFPKIYCSRLKTSIAILSIAVFATLYCVYTEKEDFFYYYVLISTSQWLLWYGLMIIAGVCGILILSFAGRRLTKLGLIPDSLIQIGQYTLSIYLMQGVLCKLAEYKDWDREDWYVYLFIAIFIFILLGSMAILLSRFKLTSKIFLGKQ